MNFGFFKYISLGFEVFNAVTTIIAMVKAPALLSGASVWEVIQPVLDEISSIAGIKINDSLAQKITNDAVDTVKAALQIPSA